MLLAATCLFGLEKQLGEEIDALGLKRVETIDGRVLFEGEEKDIPRANINLRLAERVFIVLGRFHAESFSELFDGTYSLPWHEWIGKLDEFPVTGHSIKSKLTSIPDCQSIVKKAIVNRLSAEYGISWFEETGVKYKVEFFILKDEAMLMIDTSGIALHKRGYRPDAGAAPLRETLAAAIALTSRPKDDVLIWDPFCGSGTIAIEAAMIARRIAPGLKREFAAERFSRITADLWQAARDEAASLEIKDSSFEVWASDIDEDILDVAYENALRAGVEENINIFCADARKIEKPAERRGTIVCNPPYGERMGEMREIEQLYRDIGRNFKNFEPWHIYVITSCEYFEKLYGRRADKIRKLYNGMLPCNFYQFFKPADLRNDRPQNKTFNKNKSFDNRNKYNKPKK
ncbi:MAG: class I SAM-dependent RNA methyltransferase [Clostridia bacterium]|nr:class I SAM-dependent RNA methyltransferase [Clostridia bacterium]